MAAPVSRRTSRRSSPSATNSACPSRFSRRSSGSTPTKRSASSKRVREALWVLREKRIAVWGLDLQARHRRRPQLRRHRSRQRPRQGRRPRHRLRPQGHGKSARIQAAAREREARRLPAGSRRRRRSAHPCDRMEGVCQRRPRRGQETHAYAAWFSTAAICSIRAP